MRRAQFRAKSGAPAVVNGGKKEEECSCAMPVGNIQAVTA
jgi:hypothetical protein